MSFESWRANYLTLVEQKLDATPITSTSTQNELLASGALYKMGAEVAGKIIADTPIIAVMQSMTGVQFNAWLAIAENSAAFVAAIEDPATMTGISNDARAMTTLAGSTSGLQLIFARQVPTGIVVNTSISLTAILANQANGQNALAASTYGMDALVASQTAMTLFTSASSFGQFAISQNAMAKLMGSNIAARAIAASVAAMTMFDLSSGSNYYAIDALVAAPSALSIIATSSSFAALAARSWFASRVVTSAAAMNALAASSNGMAAIAAITDNTVCNTYANSDNVSTAFVASPTIALAAIFASTAQFRTTFLSVGKGPEKIAASLEAMKWACSTTSTFNVMLVNASVRSLMAISATALSVLTESPIAVPLMVSGTYATWFVGTNAQAVTYTAIINSKYAMSVFVEAGTITLITEAQLKAAVLWASDAATQAVVNSAKSMGYIANSTASLQFAFASAAAKLAIHASTVAVDAIANQPNAIAWLRANALSTLTITAGTANLWITANVGTGITKILLLTYRTNSSNSAAQFTSYREKTAGSAPNLTNVPASNVAAQSVAAYTNLAVIQNTVSSTSYYPVIEYVQMG